MSESDAAPLQSDDPYDLIGQLNEGAYRVYQRDGYRIWLNTSESRDMAKRAVGRYEPEKFAALNKRLKAGQTVLDIGANKGDFALFAASRVGPTGHVVAVEPHPDNVGWLRKSVALNGFRTVTIKEAALADTSGEAPLHIGPKSGHHALEPLSRDRGTITVAIDTLDQVWRDLQQPTLDIVKIDVEGAEDRVVAGGRTILAQCRPVIFLDVHDIGSDRLAALNATFAELGYAIAALDDPGIATLLPDKDYILIPQ